MIDGKLIAERWDAWINSQHGVFASDPTTLSPVLEHRKYLQNRLHNAFMEGVEAGYKLTKEEVTRKFSEMILP
jgi:Fe-S cluster biosynthesis and repair protein YggX